MFVYLGVTFASHLLYNVQDVAGWTCIDSKVPPKKLLKNEKHTADFTTSDLCKSAGISVEANGKYSITVTVDDAWSDGGIRPESAASPPRMRRIGINGWR